MTPSCSVCGYAVEIVRSCFSSQWRLFRNSGITTPGEYVFAPPDTPCYPGWHNFWSRDWVSDELEDGSLGEQLEAVRAYSTGQPPDAPVGAALIGSADCIANGDTWPLAVVPTLVEGFDQRCPGIPTPARASVNPQDSANWCFWAGVLERVYVNATDARDQVAARMGCASTGFLQSTNTAVRPCFFVLTAPPPLPVVVAIAGTATAAQWIQNVAYGAGPPTDFGVFAAHLYWTLIAYQVLSEMLPLAIPADQDVIVVGHSLGGAVAAVLAAMLRLGNATRNISVLGLGAPRPGDSRLIDILRTCRSTFITNDGDPVPSIPVNASDLPPPLSAIIGGLYAVNSRAWAYPPNNVRVAWDGTRSEGLPQPGPQVAILSILYWGYTGGNIPDLSVHLPAEYARRLCAPVQNPVAWFEAFSVDRTRGDQVPVWPNLIDPTNSAEKGIAFPPPTYATGTQGMRAALEFAGAPAVNELLVLSTPLDGTRPFSLYATFQMVFGDPNYDLGYRHCVPLEGVTLSALFLTQWEGAGASLPGWRANPGIGGALFPWDGGVWGPALLSIRWDGAVVHYTFETSVVQTAAPHVTVSRFSFNFIGGEVPGTTFAYCIAQLVGEILFYGRFVSSSEDASLTDYLRIKWLFPSTGLTAESGDQLVTESTDNLLCEWQVS